MTDLPPIPFARCSPNLHTYTSGYAFQDAVLAHAKGNSVTITTFNVSTNIQSNFLPNLCKRAIHVKLLVGISPYSENTNSVLSILHYWNKTHSNLTILTGSKMHVKSVLVHQPKGIIGWAGSLNLITPTLNDLMVRLSKRQALEVQTYINQLCSQASPL